ncbi:hypothetical protein VP01_555g6 [Puccinia sorghi]|uniref:Uncharacterized protein n=1 Tax=Puccinia sorghi TaxID=27349 RepID=A0A0L6UJ82_9BASI|nr:hypothetical protein VP01_555g6 [Puccinia sorghi]
MMLSWLSSLWPKTIGQESIKTLITYEYKQHNFHHIKRLFPLKLVLLIEFGDAFKRDLRNLALSENGKGVKLKEKKSNHLVALEERKWDNGIKLEEKNFFEMAKLDPLALKENIGKNYDFITQCFVSGKSTE